MSRSPAHLEMLPLLLNRRRTPPAAPGLLGTFLRNQWRTSVIWRRWRKASITTTARMTRTAKIKIVHLFLEIPPCVIRRRDTELLIFQLRTNGRAEVASTPTNTPLRTRLGCTAGHRTRMTGPTNLPRQSLSARTEPNTLTCLAVTTARLIREPDTLSQRTIRLAMREGAAMARPQSARSRRRRSTCLSWPSSTAPLQSEGSIVHD